MKYYLNCENLALGGFAPGWYKENYPSFGNKNQASAMTNCDLTNVSYLQQGAGLANLNNNGLITTLIKGILGAPSTVDTTYGLGGNKLYQFSNTSITNNATFPHIMGGAIGEDVCWFQGKLYYSYNGTTSDIGLYDGSFTDKWGSVVPSGHANLQNAPHQMIGGGSVGIDIMYFANGRYVGNYNGTTFVPQDLDFPTGSEVQSIAWMSDRIWCAVNKTNLTGINKNSSSVYVWDGNDTTWESEIPLMGKVGGLHVKNGVLYLFYQDLTNPGGYKLAYLNGSSVVDVANFTGSLPAFYQIADYKDFIIWNSDGSIWAYGSGDKDLPPRLFQLASGGYTATSVGSTDTQFDITNTLGTVRYTYDGTGTDPLISATTFPKKTLIEIKSSSMSGANTGSFAVTGSGDNYFEVSNGDGVTENNKTLADGFLHKTFSVGGIACPFGTPVIASTNGLTYRLAKFSGYDTNCSWKSLLFDITGNGVQSTIDSVRFNLETLESGARVDWTMKNNRGETIYSDTISYDKLGAVSTAYYQFNGKKQENFRIELDYSEGSTSATVKIKSCKINGSIN